MDHTETRAPVLLLLGCSELRSELKRAGFSTASFSTIKRLLSQVGKIEANACIVHSGALGEPQIGEVIRALRRRLPFSDVVLWAPRGNARIVREALTSGARDVVLSSASEEVVETVTSIVKQQKILPRLKRTGRGGRERWRFEGLISRSEKMWDIFDICVQTAPTEATVLILGETGTGKELVARAIHRRSQRKGRFTALNCGAVPESLIDSQLFGHVKGAFTGATREQPGLFQSAGGGTLFLDEIGNIPLVAQYRLLRALQENAVRPVGGDREIAVDARVIAATSSNLDEAVAAGRFREDLLYRLDVIRILLPPLRERPEDILLLFEHFTNKYMKQYKIKRPEMNEGFLDELITYEWPGNVRQLENYTERLLLTQGDGPLTARAFRRLIKPYKGRSPGSQAREPQAGAKEGGPAQREVDLRYPLTEVVSGAVRQVERTYLQACLRRNRGRVGDTADHAGISRRTLLRKMKEYDIDKRAFRSP